MGLVKSMMMEYESQEWESTTVAFTCPECGEYSDGSEDIPKVVNNHEHELDIDINLDCIWCDVSFDAEFIKDSTGCRIILNEYLDTKVEFEPSYYDENSYDDWDYDSTFYDAPDDPFTVFKEAYTELISNIAEYARETGHSSMNRMFFSQSFSVFEAYLCDSFLDLVFLSAENQKKFIDETHEAKKLVFTLSDLIKFDQLSAAEIIRKKLIYEIKSILFHNLPKTLTLFRIYNISIFPNGDVKDFLMKSVEYRHHAVHRNGFDLEGNEINIYTKVYLGSLTKAMLEVIEHINREIINAKPL